MLGQEEHVYFEHTSGKLQGAVSMEKGVGRTSVRSTGLERQMCGGGPPGYGGGLKDTEEDEKPFSY